MFVVPHRPSCLGSDRAPRRVAGRVLLCVLHSTTGRAGARGADCLAAKEVLRPVAQPPHPLPYTHPPSGAPQMPRYSKRSCAHKPLPVDGLGGRRSDKHGPTLVRKLRRSAPSAALSIHFLSLSRSLSSHPPLPQTGLRKKSGREG